MPPPAMLPPDDDWQRVQRLLQQERERLMRLTQAAADGADNGAEIEAARHQLEALRELAEAVKARLALTGGAATLPRVRREGHRILVVDDHAPTRYGISRALRASGFRTIEAGAGAEALELSPFASALVLDVQLPDLHGFEVCRLLRSEPRTQSLPIVHVSAVHQAYADRQASRTAGADDFMLCPVDGHRLAERLDGLLSARAAFAG